MQDGLGREIAGFAAVLQHPIENRSAPGIESDTVDGRDASPENQRESTVNRVCWMGRRQRCSRVLISIFRRSRITGGSSDSKR
jgi:hypothetical protein